MKTKSVKEVDNRTECYRFIDSLPDDLFPRTPLNKSKYDNDIEEFLEEVMREQYNDIQHSDNNNNIIEHNSNDIHCVYSSVIQNEQAKNKEYQYSSSSLSDNTTQRNVHCVYSSDIQNERIINKEHTSSGTISTQNNTHRHRVYSSEIHITNRQVEILKAVADSNAREKEAEEWRTYRTGRIYEQSDFANDITSTEELMSRLKGISRKAGKNLERLYEASRVLEGYMADEVIEEVAIATTGGLARVFSKSTASEVIKLAERVDLLICTDPYYRPSWEVNGKKQKNGTARKYIINPLMVELIRLAYLGEEAKKPRSTSDKGGEEDEVAEMPAEEINALLGRYDVRFSPSVHLPACLSDEQIRACINARYPQLAVLKETMERINREYYAGEPMLQLHQRVKIRRGKSGVVSKIGTRCTSPLCQLRANDIPPDYEGQTRQMFLARYYGGRAYYEYDVKSSIYRVARFLRTGEWLAGDIDFYALMAPYEFTDKQARADYKAGLAMQLYFGGTPAEITNALYYNLTRAKRKKGLNTTKLDRLGYTKEEVREAIGAG